MARPTKTVCAECGGKMEEGWVLDESHGSHRRSEWIEGPHEPSFWVGSKLGGKTRIPITTYRCTRCGLLKLYARPSEA